MIKRGYFYVVEKCCSRGEDMLLGCPFFSRTYHDKKGYLICTRVDIPYRELNGIPLPEGSLKWSGKFPSWCPLEKKEITQT